jgi:AcrR family transcriptional regulator
MTDTSEPPTRKRRSDGERSRNAILREAARLATVEGINGLSISRLADAVGMSKSGLFAHFGSKEELQLATVEAAGVVFTDEVLTPAMAAPSGHDRVRQLVERFLDHVAGEVYPGGCFFASVAAELDTQSGPVRDRVMEVEEDFLARLVAAIRDAQDEGAINPADDPEQLAFELNAYMLLANLQWVMSKDATPIRRARVALDRLLTAAARPA